MKILVVSLFLPHQKAPHAGGRYVYELLRHLSSSHEVHLATRHEEGEAQLLEDLRPLCRAIHPHPYASGARRGLLDKLELVGSYLAFSRAANRLVAEGDYDLVLVEWVETAILIGKQRVPMILDAHDVISKPAERSFRQASGLGKGIAWCLFRITMFAERMIARRFDLVLARSEFDREYLRSLLPGVRCSIIPHPAGLDLTDAPARRQPGTILFLASYKHRPFNVQAALWFYHQVFSQVKKEVPDSRFVIAGYGPPPELTSLVADPRVTVTGFVDDIDRCYREAAVFVAPILTGGGIIVKVLDALASGTPTVCTTFGNEGICAVHERDLLLADDPSDFASAVIRLLSDRGYAEELGRNGQRFVQEYYGRESVMARLDSAIADVTGGGI